MSVSSLANDLREAFPGLYLLENEPMAAHCSFRIGGPADVFAEPESEQTLCGLWRWLKAHGVPVTVIGNGTNLLVHDEGVRGVVLRLVGGVQAHMLVIAGALLICGCFAVALVKERK